MLDAEHGEPFDSKMLEALSHLQEYIANNFEDVGKDFASKSLKMHYGVEKTRNIRGVSSLEEEKQLKNEGIPFLKLPLPAGTKGKKN